MGPNRSLVIYCSAFRVRKVEEFPNLTIKKIPKAVLHKCQWGLDDYSLEIKSLPPAPEPEPGEPHFRAAGDDTVINNRRCLTTRGAVMAKKSKKAPVVRSSPLYDRIREILESARTTVARSVNTTQVVANWLVGREIVEEEQRGERRAGYGEELIHEISERLTSEFGKGYSKDNLFWFRRFYLGYPVLVDEKVDALRQISGSLDLPADIQPVKPRRKSAAENPPAAGQQLAQPDDVAIGHTACDESWQAGQLHPNFSWTHYRTLLRVESPDARSFYEIEAIQNNWSARELERQINTLLYERLALSKDKKGLMRLAKKGQEIATPVDVFKDPVVMEFLGLPESPRLQESRLEEALIDNLQDFLLELGKGFAFVTRQDRITLDSDHFYIDLVFYHTILKCFVLIDLKVDKLTHADLGQLQLYVNYYDQHRCAPDDNPTLGLILCTDKNDAVVKYTLGPDQSQKIFASRYRLYLPSEEELRAEIRRELRHLPANGIKEQPQAKKTKKKTSRRKTR